MNRSCVLLISYTWILSILACGCLHAQAPAPLSIPPLPEAVDSFGAATLDKWLYVYGGHQGRPDEQSAQNLSRRFVRCHVRNPSEWEELPIDRPLQNLALVSCAGRLYRVGGLGVSNTDGQSLESVSEFASFDPATHQWKQLPALPAPRSSHDAIAADGKIYVIGGWHQHGQRTKDWHDAALVYDTTAGPTAQWQSLPTPSFRRRNLAVTAWQNCIWAIGGKDDSDDTTCSVYCYDPQRGYWSEGPELPLRSEGMRGYGVAASGLESGLYVSGGDGVLYRLTSMYGQWEAVAQLRIQRFGHRLLPDGEIALLAIAGNSIAYGQTSSIERIKVYTP